ncbi:MAG TPA: hypothetical protein VG425_09605 [Casimicrobiaceae bacterium]|jgi:hypothetical protein|nr:hypothetical protein [Casimicrobiaceae bacterium]
MPTARELLEQADALMRRNRVDTGIPVLTDSVPEVALAPMRSDPAARAQAADARPPRDNGQDYRREPEGLPTGAVESAPRAPPPGQPAMRGPDALATTEHSGHEIEPPLLTDTVVDMAEAIEPLPRAATESDLSLWLGPDTIDPALHSITGPAPDTVGVVPPVTLRVPDLQPEPAQFSDDRDPTVTRTLRAAGSEPTPPPKGSVPPVSPEIAAVREPVAAVLGSDDERWRALAEQMSMQVLQRLDLFVDSGLKAQLAAHLRPIVVRAGAELVEAINDHVGQLVRTYVAEAIEREIAQWRQQNK